MSEISFLKIEEKTGFIEEELQSLHQSNDLAVSLYYSNDCSYDAVKEYYNSLQFPKVDIEQIIYRLRIKINKTRYVFDKGSNVTDHFRFSSLPDLDYNIGLGIKYFTEGDFSQALDCFDKALKIDNKSLFALANKASICFINGKKHQALDLYNTAREAHPYYPQLLANKLNLIVAMPETTLEEFTATIRNLLSIHPLHPTGLNYGIQLALHKEDIDSAVTYLHDYFVNYYLETNLFPLLEGLFSKLSYDRGKAEVFELYQLAEDAAAIRVLKTFVEKYEKRFIKNKP